MESGFEAVARRALSAYGLEEADLFFLRHSDNVTYRVETLLGETMLLRLHVPVTAAMGSHGSDPTSVRSELLWLEALCRDTDLVLQQPLRSRSGSLVTPIAAAGLDRAVNCTLLRWLEGQPYHRDLESEHTARQIGQILATLHNHASGWEIPTLFMRPSRDAAYFESVLAGLRPALVDGRISPSDFGLLETSVALLIDLLGPLDRGRQRYGLVHADGHKGNMLYHRGQIRLIDFSFCAWGDFMFDLAICLSDMRPQLHPAFLTGYQGRRSLPEGYQRLVEGLFVGSMVGTFSYWVPNPQAQELLARKVPQIAREYARKFNRGEYFWFSG